MPGQIQTYPQHQQYPSHPTQEAHIDEFGTFQSVRTQPVTANVIASNQPTPYNVPQTNTQSFASFQQATASNELPSVTGPVLSDNFGIFQSTTTPSMLSTNTTQQALSRSDVQKNSNRDSFGDFQSGTNDPIGTDVSVTQQQALNLPTIPAPSDFPYWQRSIDQLPKLYQDVFNACVMTDQFLDTQRLFPILISSGLQRSLLRDIWSTVNQVQPGRLTKEELCQALGLIALAQVMCVLVGKVRVNVQ